MLLSQLFLSICNTCKYFVFYMLNMNKTTWIKITINSKIFAFRNNEMAEWLNNNVGKLDIDWDVMHTMDTSIYRFKTVESSTMFILAWSEYLNLNNRVIP